MEKKMYTNSEVSKTYLERKLGQLAEFLDQHKHIFEVCMVDFIVDAYFTTRLDSKLQEQLLDLDEHQLVYLASLDTPDELGNLIGEINKQSMEAMDVVMTTNELQTFFDEREVRSPLKSFAHFDRIMSPKKQHEVQVMSHFILHLASMMATTKLLDLGSGKSYLGQIVAAMEDEVTVVAIDGKEGNTLAAQKRISKLQSKWAGLSRRAAHRAANEGPVVPRGKHWRAKMAKKELNNESNNDSSKEENNIDVQEVSGTSMAFDRRVINVTQYVTSGTSSKDIQGLFEANREFEGESRSGKNRSTVSLETRKETSKSHKEDVFQPKEGDGTCSNQSFRFGIIGLHTCGNLASQSLDTFTANEEASFVFNVGCCYHLMSDDDDDDDDDRKELQKGLRRGFPRSRLLLQQGFKLGRNSRMMAAQPPQRTLAKEQLPSESLLYRAVLQVLLRRHVAASPGQQFHVGRIYSKCKNDFLTYFKMAVQHLGLQLQLEDSYVRETFETMRTHHWFRLMSFYQLRALFAPLVEAAILMDRFLAMLEDHPEEDAVMGALIQLFDPLLSPRCHAIIAFRKSSLPTSVP